MKVAALSNVAVWVRGRFRKLKTELSFALVFPRTLRTHKIKPFYAYA